MPRKFLKLKLRATECGYRQDELAKAAGMALPTLSRRLNGNQPWDTEQMDSVAAVLNIPFESYPEYFWDRGGAWPSCAANAT